MTQKKIPLAEWIFFALFAAVMCVSQWVLAALPNLHLTGMLTMLITLLYRKKALIPIYLYALIMGLVNGFPLWWLPYLYVWTVLWGMTMLIPKRLPTKWCAIVYPVVCGLHGLIYGTLFAPGYLLAFKMPFRQIGAYIVAGLPFDLLHAAGNTAAGLLILPLLAVLRNVMKQKKE